MNLRRYFLAYVLTPATLGLLTFGLTMALVLALPACTTTAPRTEFTPLPPDLLPGTAAQPLPVPPDSSATPSRLRQLLTRLVPAAGKARPASSTVKAGKVKYRNATINNTYVVGNQNEVKQGGVGKSTGPAQVAADSGATLNAASKAAQLNNAPNNHGTFAPRQEGAADQPWYSYLLSPTGKVVGLVVGAGLVGGIVWLLLAWRRKKAASALAEKAVVLAKSGLGSKVSDFL